MWVGNGHLDIHALNGEELRLSVRCHTEEVKILVPFLSHMILPFYMPH